MAERKEIRYGQKVQGLKFHDGEIFQGPKADISGKFVRIGKLIVVSADSLPDHRRLISKPGLGAGDAGDKDIFIMTAQRLADRNSANIDAGWILISSTRRKITLGGRSTGLCRGHTVPVNSAAREITRDIIEVLSPGFTVILGPKI